jgi:ribosomal protein S18 acetylase RimI-like enzyme
MSVLTSALEAPPPQLRPLEIYRDLGQVADLIELCFAATMDRDGREYLRQMRQVASDPFFPRWVVANSSPGVNSYYGYVWEENGRVVGNLSMIPVNRYGTRVFMLANIAVHPNYRSRGIARALTSRALDFVLHERRSNAWLQVRQDNPIAHHLYISLGFEERARRTNWEIHPSSERSRAGGFMSFPFYRSSTARPGVPGMLVTRRQDPDWPLQKSWLSANYPTSVAWGLPLRVEYLAAGLWNTLKRFSAGIRTLHWAARPVHQLNNGTQPALAGVLSWVPTHGSTDNLWLATPITEDEDPAIRALLGQARLAFPDQSLSVNYEAGRAVDAFLGAGFSDHQTLIWMENTSPQP